jgi:hypothetical protein
MIYRCVASPEGRRGSPRTGAEQRGFHMAGSDHNPKCTCNPCKCGDNCTCGE